MFSILLIAMLAGVIWRRRQLPTAVKVLTAAVFLFAWMPLSMVAVRVMQSSYSRQPPQDHQADAIVVLAGAVHEPFPPLPGPLLGSNTYERCRYGAWLHLHWSPLPVLLSGGPIHPGQPSVAAVAMREQVMQEGVPATSILLEDRSLSTAQNASYTAPILKRLGISRIVLVTDAVHMRRARATFEKQGFVVIPAPCNFHPVYEFDLEDSLPGWQAAYWNEELVHELVGYLWYRIRGSI